MLDLQGDITTRLLYSRSEFPIEPIVSLSADLVVAHLVGCSIPTECMFESWKLSDLISIIKSPNSGSFYY